jgi:outer membrane receptor protein involved in Fe transport
MHRTRSAAVTVSAIRPVCRRRARWLGQASLAWLLLPGGAALAQGAAPAAPAAPAPEQITVTAEKRRQSVQTVGSSISVISGRELAAHNVNTVFDLQYQTPSLTVTPQFGSGQLEFSIRGVGFEDYASNNAPTVGLYVDEVAFPIPYETDGQIYDVARVEVLRGPQGTLYGRNTTGGAINYVLNKPTQAPTGGLTVQYGRFNAALVEGHLSGSIAPNVQMRVSGETQQGGAWQHGPDGQMLGNLDKSSLRALIDWEPTDTLTIEATMHGSHDRSDALGTHLYAPNTALLLQDTPGVAHPVFPVDPNRDDTSWGTSPLFAREIGISPGTKPFEHIDTGGISLRADQRTDYGTITDLVSYDYAGRREYDDFDASPLALADVYFNTRANVFANELRFTSPSGGMLTYLAGIYYGNQYLADNYRGGFDRIYGVDTSVQYSQKVNTVSGFGQASFKVTPVLTLTGGLRIEYEERKLEDFGSYFLYDGAVINPDNNVPQQSTSYTKPSGKIELQYVPFADDMAYAQISRGVKSGGFTTYNTGSPKIGTAPFQPETLWAYEIGNKLEVPDARLRFNISAFYYQYQNQQIQAAVLNATTGLIGSIVNAPRSHLYGGEIEAEWTPIDNLILSQTAGESIGAFDEFTSLFTDFSRNGVYYGVYQNRAGEALPFPKLTLNGSATYKIPLQTYFLATSVDYSLRTTYNSLFGALYNVAGYTLVNAHATFGPNSGKWSVTAYGANILNKRYDIDRNYFDLGDDIATAGLPATYGVRATVSF